jgi:hypothetical protein
VPGQYVAKNEQGHVVAAGDTPEQARALAEERLNRRNADTTPANAPPEQSQTGQPRADLSALEQSQPGQQPSADLSGRPDEHLKEPAAPPPEPGSQLAKLTATRDALAAAPGPKGKPRTAAQESKLLMLDAQIRQLQRSQQARARKPVPGEGGPTAPGREVFDKYKFNSGPSVFRSVFEAAGHNPDLAVNKPIAWQNKVLSDHMEHAFGFRKVSLAHDATPVDAKTARDHMLDMTRSIQDMMASLGETPDAASINGRVALTFDPLGKRNYYGAYDPGTKTIRISGNANSFAHEWAHAVDHFLAEDFNRASNRNELLTRYAQHGELDPKDGVQGAWAKVLNAVFYDKSAQASRQIELANTAKQTDKQGAPTAAAVKAQQDLKSLEAGGLRLGIQPSKFRAAAKEAGKGTSRPAYYTDPAELLARGREAQIAWKMETNGVDPRGVAMPDRAYLNESIKAFKELYPKAEDRMNIFKAFDDLDHEMAKKSILSLDKAPAEFGNFGVSDPRHYPKTVPGLEASPTAMSVKDQSRMWKNKTKQLETMKMVEAARPNPPKNLDWKTQQLDAAKSVIYSDHGLMEMHINRQTPEAQKPLREILDLLTPSPSSGRYTGEGLLEAQRQMEGDWNRRALNILKSAGVKSFGRIPADIDAMTRDVLVTGEPRYTPDLAKPDETVAAPDKVIKVAGDMRGLMDELYQASRDAGLPVGYADRYYPRMYDQAKALDQPDKFREQAAKAYGVGFDKEVGAPGADPQAALEHWTTLSAADKSLSYEKHPDLAEQMKALSKNLERQREIEQGGDLGSDEFTALKAEAQKLAAEAHPALRDHVSSFAANDWHNRISDAVSHHIDAQGSSGSYLNGRTLPPEADIHMRDFMHTSLRDVLPKYINNVARRVADAERFGPNGENLERLRKAAIDAGVHPETMNDFMESVDRTRGMNQERAPGGLTKTVGVIHAFSSMVMMPRSVWSQLTEPINLALSSHNLTAGLRASVYEIGALLRTASAAERSEFADFVGAVHYAQQDSIMNSRLGFDYADQPGLTKFMGNYFKLTGMTPATNGQRAGIAAASHYVLAKLARSYLNEKGGFAAGLKRDEAVRSFNELGIHPEVQPAFARWLADLPARPTATALMQDKSGMAGAYGLAVRRVTDRAHQDPYKVDRAAMSMHPAFKLPFQMMSFNYSFQRNVINPAFHRIGHAYDWTKEAAQEKGYGAVGSRALALSMASGTAVKTFSIASTLVGASLMTTMVRQYLFSPDQWEQHKKDGDLFEWLRDLAMQRSGINGVLDPAVQVLTNLRYLSDLQSLYGGGGPTWILKNAQDMLAPLTSEPDDKTNTKMWRSVHGALNLIGLPLLAAGLNTLGAFGGPAGRVAAGATLQATTSSYAINKATNMIMGPKGAKKPTGDDELDDSADSELDDQALDDGDTAGSTKKSSGGIGGPIGLLDDVAMPLIRILAPAVNIIPGPVKAGLAGLGAAYAAAKVWQAGAPFRGQPAPAKH